MTNGIDESAESFEEDSQLDFGDSDDEQNEDDFSASDAGEFDGTEDNGEAQEPPRKKRKKAPALTAEEIRSLSFAQLVASPLSSALKLRVEALLDKATPPSPADSPLQPLLKGLHSYILALKHRKPVSLEQLAKSGTTVPPLPDVDDKWLKLPMSWEPPSSSDVRIVGDWPWGGATRTDRSYTVEMAIAMPKDLLQPKDYLHPRFLARSTHYLVHIAAHLPESLGPVDVSFVPLPQGRGWALQIRGEASDSASRTGLAKVKGASLLLHVAWPEDVFPLPKTSPTANLNRPRSAQDETQSEHFPPTPVRSSQLHAASLQVQLQHMSFKHELSKSIPAFGPACRLLRLWAEHSPYPATLGVTQDFWTWCTARAVRMAGGGASDPNDIHGSAWAIWRKTIEWLGSVSWTDGVWFRPPPQPQFARDVFKEAFKGQAIFIDPTYSTNLVAGVDLSTLLMLKQDARATLSMLFAIRSDVAQVETAFVSPVLPIERFDNVYRIKLPPAFFSQTSSDLDRSTREASIQSLRDTIRRALSNRVSAFMIECPSPPAVPFQGRAAEQDAIEVELGVILDPQESVRLVDHGPSAEDEDGCVEFRDFWGPKAELRRFKDGSIVQTVVWDSPSPGGLGIVRPAIVGTILEYILGHRHGIPPADIFQHKASFDNVLVENERIRRAIYLDDAVATNKGFSAVLGAFSSLSKQLQSLSDIPLSITSVQPVSPALRYTSSLVPSPRRLNGFSRQTYGTKFVESFDVLITLEGSGRWPDDLEGVQKIKAAFLARIGGQLESQAPVRSAQVVFDVDARPIDDNVSLEVITAAGFAFRLRIFYERSRVLLIRRANMLQLAENAPLVEYERRFSHAPAHHSALAALQHHRTSFSPAARLLRRWLASHMLLPHIPVELVELVAAKVFLDSEAPVEAPNSGVTAFARIMRLLATWKWQEQPLLVPLYSAGPALASDRKVAFPDDSREQSLVAFEKLRAQDRKIESFAWVICTERDIEGRVWGESTNRVVAARVKTLAKATLAAMSAGVQQRLLDPLTLFTPDLSGYSFLIKLNESMNPRAYQALATKIMPLKSKSILSSDIPGENDQDEVRPDLDVVREFVHELQTAFKDIMMLFCNPEGGNVVGGIWNPAYEQPKQFKANMGYPVKPVIATGRTDLEGSVKVVLDKDAVFADVKRLGNGLVLEVVAQ